MDRPLFFERESCLARFLRTLRTRTQERVEGRPKSSAAPLPFSPIGMLAYYCANWFTRFISACACFIRFLACSSSIVWPLKAAASSMADICAASVSRMLVQWPPGVPALRHPFLTHRAGVEFSIVQLLGGAQFRRPSGQANHVGL